MAVYGCLWLFSPLHSVCHILHFGKLIIMMSFKQQKITHVTYNKQTLAKYMIDRIEVLKSVNLSDGFKKIKIFFLFSYEDSKLSTKYTDWL